MSYTVGSTRVINTTSSSGTTDFTFTFPYIKEAHIEVYKNYNKINQGTGATEYQVITNVSPTLIRLGTGIESANLRVEIRRNSSLDSPLVDYADGSTLTANDLDTSALQSLYIDQELKDSQFQTVTTSESTGLPSLGNKRLTEVADPTAAQDAATKNYVNTQDTLQVTKAGDSMTGALAMGTNKVTGVGDPTAAQDVATKNYVDTKVFSSGQLANVVVTTTNITDGTIVAGDLATGALDGRYYTETELDAGQLDNRYYTETELNAGQLDNRYFTETELTGGALDGRYFTETEADARYFNVSTGDTIKDGDTFPDNDTTIATTAAINDRIIDLVDDVGGFVPIANETSFPNANPDVNNGTGTLVSIKALASNLTSNGSGVATIANGTVGNSTVTITGLANSTTYAATFGMIVETTSTLNTYTFHRQVPKATEVTTVAGSITNINNVGGSISNVNTVAGNLTNINTVGGISANVTTVAGVAANVTTVATNISSVNNFADLYQIASSAPSTDGGSNALAAGDLYFNTSSNELQVHTGSAWQGGVTATGNLVAKSGDTLTGNLVLDNAKEIRLSETDANGSHYLGFKAPDSVTADVTLTLPDGAGSNGQYLKTNGSNTLSWGTISSTPEGTAILSTGESGGTKFLREDGDNSCSWQTIPVPTAITVADESTDTSCNVLFTTAATGDLAPKTGTNLTFNSNTGILTATGFAGDITGDVTGNTSGSSGSCTGNAVTATNASGLTGSPNITVGTIGCGAITGTSTVADSKGNVRSIPQNTQGSAYTLVASDAGKHIFASGTVTIPNSVFSAGDAVTIVNNTSSNLTITKSISTMYNAADGTSANRTLATRGMATILFTSGTVAYISGAGLS
jgi:hypothetical protein